MSCKEVWFSSKPNTFANEQVCSQETMKNIGEGNRLGEWD
jgi:hypothetical protein